MTMTQISQQATALGFTREQHELLMTALQVGMTAGVQDAAMTLADNGEESAAELLGSNYGFEVA